MPQEYETLKPEEGSRSIGHGNSGSKYRDYDAIGTRDDARDAKDLERGDSSMGANGEGGSKAEKSSKLGENGLSCTYRSRLHCSGMHQAPNWTYHVTVPPSLGLKLQR